MKENDPTRSSTVFVIDGDRPVRDAVSLLLQSVGLLAKAFASPREFLQTKLPRAPSCLVLEVRFPGFSGLDFQNQLAKANIDIPIVFMTAHGDIPMSVKAMKAGAVEFLTKPFREQALLDAVRIGLERARVQHETDKALATAKACLDSLSSREREVLALASTGLMNKQVAGQLGVSDAAHTAKAPFIRLADRYALLLFPIALAVAGGAWLFSGDPIRGLAVLVAATPCPLILAAPVAFIAGVGQAARLGILIKNGRSFEALARTHTVMFDKTWNVDGRRSSSRRDRDSTWRKPGRRSPDGWFS